MSNDSLRSQELSPKRRILLQLLMAEKQKAKDASSRPIPRQRESEQVPLSFVQHGLWFLYQFQPDKPVYNIPVAVRLIGSLNPTILKRSLDGIVQRHETLRTSFTISAGQPVQIIHPHRPARMAVVDLQSLPPHEREAAAQRLVAAVARQPFDLVCDPLLRVTLFCLAADAHLLLMTVHHIIADGWSMNILISELAAFYSAFNTGQPPSLPALSIQYADYAIWQRQYLQGPLLAQLLDYWKHQLADAPPTLELLTERQRPAVQTFAGARQLIVFSSALTDALELLSRREGVTLFMLLLAALNALFTRYTGQNDIVIGSPTANRKRTELQGLIGCFVNMLALRIDMTRTPAPRFRDLLAQTRTVAIGAYDHQELPFERLVEELQPERDLSRSPLFQVTLSFQNMPESVETFTDLGLSYLELDNGTVPCDLAFMFWKETDGLAGTLDYSTDLFDVVTIARMIGHFRTLLEGIVANPARHLADLPVLTAAERQQMLVDWNDPQAARPIPACWHRLFEQQVWRTPDAVAVGSADGQLTYRMLDQRASTLMRHLKARGIMAEQIVALLAERSSLLLIGIIAVLKAGAAYLPLDPRHPPARLQQILEQSSSALVLTTGSFVPVLAPIVEQSLPSQRPQVLCIEELICDAPAEATASVDGSARALACVIYTSGSTGAPKGAMIEQHGMLNHLSAKINDLGLSAADRIAQNASQCFVISVWQFLAPLLVGGHVAIVADDDATDPTRLLAQVEREQLSILEIVPSLLQAMLEELAHRAPMRPHLSALRWLIPTGEALPMLLSRQWLDSYPRIQLLNAYGQTESSDDVTHYRIDGVSTTLATQPIGRPIAGIQIYILDRALAPVAIGRVGVLFVGGIGVGRGYLNDPWRTAEVFRPDPFTAKPGSRLYQTGDLVRYRRDGVVEYLGRRDHQIKLRGVRIELDEIAALLAQHADVRDAVVRASGDQPGDRRLVAYVVTTKDERRKTSEESDSSIVHRPSSIVQELRDYLQQRLPRVMVPSAFVLLDALPLTPNGKLDRRALSALSDQSRLAVNDAFVAPRTPIEEVLAGIWADVLQLDGLGIHDNFFDLGGHSLLATQIMFKLGECFQVELPIRCLFEAPTVAGLAEQIERNQRVLPELLPPPLLPVARDGALPLSFAQQRHWLLDQMQPGNPIYNMSTSIRLVGVVDLKVLAWSLNTILQRHEVARTTFAMVNGRVVQVIAPSLRIGLPLLDLCALPATLRGKATYQHAKMEAQRSFDLRRGPLIRVMVLRLSTDEHVLLLTMHHISSDAWSMGVLRAELTALYTAALTGQTPALPELPIQYADYAVWQRRWLTDAVLALHLNYWKAQLADLPAEIALPTDRPRPAVQTFRGMQQPFTLPPELVGALRMLSRQTGATLFMVLLAAFLLLLQRFSGQDDLVIGSPTTGRTRSELEGLLGCFINTLVLRVNLSGIFTFRALLELVRSVCLGAYTHQELPFEKLVEALQPNRDLSRQPLFQVVLNFMQAPEEAIALPGLTLHLIEAEKELSKYDLTLYIWEDGPGLSGTFTYSTDLFDATTIARLRVAFEVLLQSIVAQPEARLNKLEIRTEAEKNIQLLNDEDRQQASIKRLKNIRRKAFRLPNVDDVDFNDERE